MKFNLQMYFELENFLTCTVITMYMCECGMNLYHDYDSVT